MYSFPPRRAAAFGHGVALWLLLAQTGTSAASTTSDGRTAFDHAWHLDSNCLLQLSTEGGGTDIGDREDATEIQDTTIQMNKDGFEKGGDAVPREGMRDIEMERGKLEMQDTDRELGDIDEEDDVLRKKRSLAKKERELERREQDVEIREYAVEKQRAYLERRLDEAERQEEELDAREEHARRERRQVEMLRRRYEESRDRSAREEEAAAGDDGKDAEPQKMAADAEKAEDGADAARQESAGRESAPPRPGAANRTQLASAANGRELQAPTPTWSHAAVATSFPLVAGLCSDLGLNQQSFTLLITAKENATSLGALFGTGPQVQPSGRMRRSLLTYMNGGGGVEFNFFASDCAGFPGLGSMRGVDEWTQYAFVYDMDASEKVIYVNGAEVGRCSNMLSFVCTAGSNVRVGCAYDTVDECQSAFVGQVKDASIIGGAALSAAQIPQPPGAGDDETDQSSVVGDPHVTNAAMAHFNIRAAGEHKLVQIPRKLDSDQPPNLRVDAVVEHLGADNCSGTFLTGLTFFGRWTGNLGLMKVSPGSDAPNTTLQVNTLAPEEFFRMFNGSGVKAEAGSFEMRLSDIHFRVSKHYEGRYGKQRAYLNLRARGLRRYKDLGGLLGYDDRTKAETPPASCTQAPPAYASGAASLVGTGASSRTAGGGSQIDFD